jgi:tight adherence protein C
MDTIFNFFRSVSSESDGQHLLFLITAGATMFLFALGVSFLVLAATDPVRRRLSSVSGATDAGGRLAQRLLDLLAPINNLLLPSKSGERGRVADQLSFAGFRSANALPLYYAAKTALALIFLLAVLFASFWLPKIVTTKLLFYAMLASFIGLMLPNYVLDYFVKRRQKRLRDGFPDALDMLVVCVEAGLGLTAAIQRVAEELRLSHPELGAEFALVSAEMRAGVEREAALKALGVRTGLDDIRGLVSLLIQTLKFGTSVAETLRVYSEEFRDKRMQRAEELAAKIGTKLIFPLVLCLFPAFFVVAIGPAALRIIHVFRDLGS